MYNSCSLGESPTSPSERPVDLVRAPPSGIAAAGAPRQTTAYAPQMRRLALLPVLALLALAPAAAAIPATETTVTSFDGTQIGVHLMPQTTGTPAATVLVGPGWGGAGAQDTTDSEVAFLYNAGYNVVSWAPRGFGESGGIVGMDTPSIDGRDVSAIIDYVAAQPWAQLDGPSDPRIGMFGGSYGGGIQYATASDDGRIDALVPIVGWHSLRTSLYPRQTYKAGWARLLYGSGKALADKVGEGLPPELGQAFDAAEATGELPGSLFGWFDEHGPSLSDIADIKAPTLVVGGTPDTLFQLDQQVSIYDTLRTNGTTVKLLWFCGGHGTCSTGNGGGSADGSAPSGSAHLATAALNWFSRYLRGGQTGTGPGFEWVSDDERWRSAAKFPAPAGAPVNAAGGRARLRLTPGSGGGSAVAAAPAQRGEATIRVPVKLRRAAQIVGAPVLRLTYSGKGSAPTTRVFAQLVDVRRKLVVGNQATPVALRLDGRVHTLRTSLALIATTARPGARYELQLVPASQLWDRQRVTGTVTVRKTALRLPTVRVPAGK